MAEKENMLLLNQIAEGNEKAFESLFKTWYGPLCLFAARLLKDNDLAEEIVQNVFVKIWEKREELAINTSLKNYLLAAVRNQCFNQIERRKVRDQHIRKILTESNQEPASPDDFLEPEVVRKIEESILSLPEKRREIFRLSREEGLKYREIAERLHLSVKTVEAQMGLALKTLREKLRDFTQFLFFFVLFRNRLRGKSDLTCQ